MIDESFLIGALVLVVILYLLCHKVEQYMSQKELEKKLYGYYYGTYDEKEAKERYLVGKAKEKYLVEKAKEMYLVEKAKEKYLVEKAKKNMMTDEEKYEKKQEAFEEHFVQENRDLLGRPMKDQNVDGEAYPAVEQFGANPLDQLSDTDFTHPMYSSHNMEPFSQFSNMEVEGPQQKDFWNPEYQF